MLSGAGAGKSRNHSGNLNEKNESPRAFRRSSALFSSRPALCSKRLQAVLLAVIGRVGTGKSTVARELGNELNWPVFSSDQIRKTLAGVPLTRRTPARKRAEVYSRQMTGQTYKELLARGLLAAETHGGAIVDATFSSAANRESFRQKCEKAHVRFQAVELEVEPGEIEHRLRARNKSIGVISDARLEDLEKLLA